MAISKHVGLFFAAPLALTTLIAEAVACGTSHDSSPLTTDAGTPDASDDDANADATPIAPRPADAILGTDRDAMFNTLSAAILDFELISTDGLTRLGTTLDLELARARARFENADTKLDAYYALVSLHNSIHDGHSDLELSSTTLTPDAPPVLLPISVRVEYDAQGNAHYIVKTAPNGSIPLGSEILAVDGQAIADFENAQLEWFPEGSSREGLRAFAASFIASRDPYYAPRPAVNATSTLHVAPPSGTAFDQTFTWKEPTGSGGSNCPPFAETCATVDPDGDYATLTPEFVGIDYCVYATANPAEKIIRYFSFYYPDPTDSSDVACLAPKLGGLSYTLGATDVAALGTSYAVMQKDESELLQSLRDSGVTKILFDVRENGGGSFDPLFFANFAASSYAIPLKAFYFSPGFKADPSLIDDAEIFLATADGTPVSNAADRITSDLTANPNATYSQNFPFFCTTDACAASEATYAPDADAGTSTPIGASIFVGPSCFSACDDFVAIMHDNGIAKTVGLPEGAGDSPFRYTTTQKLADGSKASFTLTVGASFHMPQNTVPLEAHPVTVDFPLPPSAQNRGTYLSAALSAAGF